MQYPDKPLIIIGPSGAGKSSAIRLLHDEGLIEVTPTWTTRPTRPGELKESIEHKFVSGKKFAQMKKSGGFLYSIDTIFGLPYKYGLPKISKVKGKLVPVVILRADHIPIIAKFYNNFVVYQIVDTYKRISVRLKERKVKGEKIGLRLKEYKMEIKKGEKVANRIFKNDNEIKSLADKINDSLKIDFKDIL